MRTPPRIREDLKSRSWRRFRLYWPRLCLRASARPGRAFKPIRADPRTAGLPEDIDFAPPCPIAMKRSVCSSLVQGVRTLHAITAVRPGRGTHEYRNAGRTRPCKTRNTRNRRRHRRDEQYGRRECKHLPHAIDERACVFNDWNGIDAGASMDYRCNELVEQVPVVTAACDGVFLYVTVERRYPLPKGQSHMAWHDN